MAKIHFLYIQHAGRMIIRPYNPTARRREEKNGRDRIGRARYSTLFILHSTLISFARSGWKNRYPYCSPRGAQWRYESLTTGSKHYWMNTP